MENLRLPAILLFTLAALNSPQVSATSFAERPFPDGVKDAPNIVRGKIGNSYSDWGKAADGVRRIYTYYDLQLGEAFKGNLANKDSRNLVIRELGGQKDGLGMEVAGTAKFDRGEDVVIFLNDRGPDGSYDVRGMMMGKYNVSKDADGKEIITGAGLSPSYEHQIHDAETGNNDTPPQKMTLEALRQLIASQKDTQPNSPPSPKLTPTAKPSNAAASDAQPEAPRLQSDSPQQGEPEGSGEQQHLTWIWIFVGIATAGILAWLLTRLLR